MKDEGTSQISDGYHTFAELYRHRGALFVALANAFPNQAWRSKLHSDGTMFDGFFIAGMDLQQWDKKSRNTMRPRLAPISYHLEMCYWEFLEGIRTYENAPKWDGHTPNDVVERLLRSI